VFSLRKSRVELTKLRGLEGMNRAKLEFMMRDINNVNSFEKEARREKSFVAFGLGMPRACLECVKIVKWIFKCSPSERTSERGESSFAQEEESRA
jgi:hypothetical protein